MSVWYRVRDLEAGTSFYRDLLGFHETFHDQEGRWAQLQRDDLVRDALRRTRGTRIHIPRTKVRQYQ